MIKLFDAHCHLQLSQYEGDLPEVLARMQTKEMGAVVIGTDIEDSKAGVALAENHDFLWAAVGLHPNDNLEEQFDAAAYETLAQHPKVVAIGECGLDYYKSGKTAEEKAAQKSRFEAQIALSRKLGKTLVIHCRDAHADCIEILREAKLNTPVILHFFTGTTDDAQKYLNLGCYVSFAGPVTFTNMYDDAVRLVPIEKLLIETDSPFAAPAPYRGTRAEPAYVEEVARKVAAIKGISVEKVAAQTAQNAQKAFGLR